MKTLVSAILALGFLAGIANAAPVAKVQSDTVVEWGCNPYGH